MSTEFKSIECSNEDAITKLKILRFYGGDKRGVCVSLSPVLSNGALRGLPAVLNRTQAIDLINELKIAFQIDINHLA